MTATRGDLSRWFDSGLAQGTTHMIVAVDRYDNENFPVYVSAEENVHEVEIRVRCGHGLIGVDEVYDLRLDKDMQFVERRAFHY